MLTSKKTITVDSITDCLSLLNLSAIENNPNQLFSPDNSKIIAENNFELENESFADMSLFQQMDIDRDNPNYSVMNPTNLNQSMLNSVFEPLESGFGVLLSLKEKLSSRIYENEFKNYKNKMIQLSEIAFKLKKIHLNSNENTFSKSNCKKITEECYFQIDSIFQEKEFSIVIFFDHFFSRSRSFLKGTHSENFKDLNSRLMEKVEKVDYALMVQTFSRLNDFLYSAEKLVYLHNKTEEIKKNILKLKKRIKFLRFDLQENFKFSKKIIRKQKLSEYLQLLTKIKNYKGSCK